MASQIAETYGSVQRISEEILDFGIAIAEAQQLKKAMDAGLSHLREELSGKKQQRSISLERLRDSVNLLIETYAVNVKSRKRGRVILYCRLCGSFGRPERSMEPVDRGEREGR